MGSWMPLAWRPVEINQCVRSMVNATYIYIYLISTQIQTVADEAGHRDAAVLDLGVAQEADGGVARVERLVECRDRDHLRLYVTEVERVPVADLRVELVGQSDELGGTVLLHNGGRTRR